MKTETMARRCGGVPCVLATILLGMCLQPGPSAEGEAKGRIVGKVRFPDGSVPQDATVYLNPETAQPMPQTSPITGQQAIPKQRQTRLGRDGSFAFGEVEPWSMGWALEVKGQGFVAPPTYELRLSVKPGKEVRRDVTVYHGGVISGRVTRTEDGKPVKGARLWFNEQDPPVQATSGPDGRYRLSPVRPGKWSVACEAKGSVLAGRAAEVKEQQETKGIDLALERGGFVVGKVLMPDGKPAAILACVWLEPVGPGREFHGAVLGAFHVGEDGSFRTAPEPPGIYELKAEWPVGKGMKRTHRAILPRVVVRRGEETRVTVKLLPTR